jgi:CRP-like cAMP-binding protein
MRQNRLGKLFQDGEVIVRKGDSGHHMYLIQKGALEVVVGGETVNTLGSGDFFGEMSLFTGQPRSATVRSRGESRVLTIDRTAFMNRIQEDPVLAFRLLEKLCDRLHVHDARTPAQ